MSPLRLTDPARPQPVPVRHSLTRVAQLCGRLLSYLAPSSSFSCVSECYHVRTCEVPFSASLYVCTYIHRCLRKFWDITDPSKLGIYTLSVEAALDEDNDELEVELGTCDPRLDDPSLSFSTVTTADPTSSGEAGSSSLQDGEAVSVAGQTEQDMSGLTRILEQTTAPNNNHIIRRSPVRTLLGEAMGKFRIPKKSKAAASTQLVQATPPPMSDPASSSMLHKYLTGEDIHREGLFYILTGPGGLSQRGPDPQGEGMCSYA